MALTTSSKCSPAVASLLEEILKTSLSTLDLMQRLVQYIEKRTRFRVSLPVNSADCRERSFPMKQSDARGSFIPPARHG